MLSQSGIEYSASWVKLFTELAWEYPSLSCRKDLILFCNDLQVVMAHSVSLPSSILEFSNPNKDWLNTEIDKVRTKWTWLFADVTNCLNSLNNQNPRIPMMLKDEINEFEGLCGKLYDITAPTACTLLALNQLRWEVLILASLWDLRLLYLHSKVVTEDDLSKIVTEEEDGWVWESFTGIRNCCKENLYNAYSPLLGKLTKNLLVHSRDFVGSVSQIVFEEGSRFHIPLNDASIVSNFQGEISSYIACALTLLEYYSPQAIHFGSEVIQRSAHHLLRPIPSYASLSKKEIDHEITFGVDQFPMVKCSVVIVCANEFRAFRQQCCPSEESYIASLSRCRRWDAQGGKSKALFAKTLDDRLVIKEIEKTEVDTFEKLSSDYFRHMTGSVTCLAKILGIYQVTFTQHETHNREKNCTVMVMENLPFCRNIQRKYDLKGTLNSARVTKSSDVFLDIKFAADMKSSPIYLEQSAKTLLNQVILRDTQFLEANNIMDYSLLLGVDENQKQLVCGIIDYLQQYTFNKQVETLAKSSIMGVSPTVVPPDNYASRFREFINSRFRTS